MSELSHMRLAWQVGVVILIMALPAIVCAQPTVSLENPSFEEGLAGWHPMPEAAGATVTGQQELARTGQTSVRVSAREALNPWLAQGVGEVEPRATYLAEAYVQRELGPGRAAVKLEFYDAEDNYLRGYYGLPPDQPEGEWIVIQAQGEAPEGAAKAVIILRLLGPGTVYFDDAQFALIQPPPPVILLPARLVAPAQPGMELSLQARIAAEQAAPEGTPQAFLAGPGGEQPQPVELQARATFSERHFALKFTLPPVEPGVYKLQITWPNLAPALAEVVLLPSGQPLQVLDAQGHFRHSGQVYFPLGLYHVALDDFLRVAAAGFNVVQIPPPATAEELTAAVQAAQDLGLLLLVPLYPALRGPEEAEATLALVEQFSEESSIFGWLLADEPELRPTETQSLAELYIRVRQADSYHPVLLGSGPEADLAAWAPLGDALLVKLLPRAGEAADTLTERMRQAAEAVREGQSWLAVLPVGWPGQPPPTAEQARTYAYRALLGGAGGIMWFSLREGSWDLTRVPLWTELPRLSTETRELAEAWRQGENWGDLEISVEQVQVQAVRFGDRAHLILLNDSPHALAGYLRVPEPIREAEYLDGEEEVSFRNRTISFELPAGGARALRLSLGPPAEETEQPAE